jgi:hypothetical protein
MIATLTNFWLYIYTQVRVVPQLNRRAATHRRHQHHHRSDHQGEEPPSSLSPTGSIINRLIADRGFVDAIEAGSFVWAANASRMDSLAFSHSSRSCSRVMTSGSASSGRLWPSKTVSLDENFTSKVFNPEVIFCSNDRASLYAALNFREPDEQLVPVCENHQKTLTGARTDLGH